MSDDLTVLGVDGVRRSYAEYEASDVRISFQDDGKTLKVFLKNKGTYNE